MAARGGAYDSDIGLDRFLTKTPGLGGRLKTRVDDFLVAEVGGLPPEAPEGPFAVATVRLTNWETNKFVNEASERLRISRKKIHFSGTKDKRAVTTQVFTFEAPTQDVEALARMPGVALERVYRARTETQLGTHDLNRFEIVLRNVDGRPAECTRIVEETLREARAAGGFPNTFGPQRFGAVRATTHLVGERIIRGDFRGAIDAYLGAAPFSLDEAATAEWDAAMRARDHRALLRLAHGDQGFERAMLHRLVERPDDPVYALLGLPKNLQLLFVYAFQSLLFNRIVTKRIADGVPVGRAVDGDLIAPIDEGVPKDEWVPVDGRNLDRVNAEVVRGRAVPTGLLMGTEVPLAVGVPGEIERYVLAGARVTRSDFVVPEHLEWSSRGHRRALAVHPSDMRVTAEADELHPGRTKIILSFTLPRGSYATSILREIMKSPRLSDYA